MKFERLDAKSEVGVLHRDSLLTKKSVNLSVDFKYLKHG